MSEANKSLSASIWQAIAGGNWPVVENAYHPNVAYHGSGPAEVDNRGDFMTMARGYKTAFPAMRAQIQAQVAEDNLVTNRVTVTGKHTGDLFGMPPTGKDIKVDIIQVQRVEGGKVVEEWEVWDQLEMMRQLGVIPPAEGH